ncbi:hypothetical protein D9758_017729 [Tetrapyrgos nigripes]|uniref:Uncharacterized protein n=1 Tax=Tetrapyrgos nigripes TaxID=182062 RepID=A0A8H5F9X7_9AGAR|nr:hypothetical protein D9758_017729 [Tetrapyrgos nigripes]
MSKLTTCIPCSYTSPDIIRPKRFMYSQVPQYPHTAPTHFIYEHNDMRYFENHDGRQRSWASSPSVLSPIKSPFQWNHVPGCTNYTPIQFSVAQSAILDDSDFDSDTEPESEDKVESEKDKFAKSAPGVPFALKEASFSSSSVSLTKIVEEEEEEGLEDDGFESMPEKLCHLCAMGALKYAPFRVVDHPMKQDKDVVNDDLRFITFTQILNLYRPTSTRRSPTPSVIPNSNHCHRDVYTPLSASLRYRRIALRDDPWVSEFTKSRVKCRGCQKVVRMSIYREYEVSYWIKHRDELCRRIKEEVLARRE